MFQGFLIHWYQQCVTVHYVPKCMGYHGAIGGLVNFTCLQFLFTSRAFYWYNFLLHQKTPDN